MTFPGGDDSVLVILSSSLHVQAVLLYVTKLVTVEALALKPASLLRDVVIVSVAPSALVEPCVLRLDPYVLALCTRFVAFFSSCRLYGAASLSRQ